MRTCKQCNANIPWWIWIDNKHVSLRSRTYCLECSPYGSRSKNGLKGDPNKNKKGLLSEHICPLCNKTHYNKNLQTECSACRSQKRRRKNKELLVEYKGGKCEICGYNKNTHALDFHHIDPNTKEFTISRLIANKSLEKIKQEVDKCKLVCANCHRELHLEKNKHVPLV